MRRALALAIVIAALATPAAAAEERSAESLAKEGLAKLLDAMQLLIDEIPQYAAPEVLPNGDIIIRRLDKRDRDEEEAEPERQPAPSEAPTDT